MISTTTPAGAAFEQLEYTRHLHLVDRLVCVGGHPGNGKTMLTPIVGGMDRVEIQKFNYALEHVCVVTELGHMRLDAAAVIIGLLTDQDLYHLAMGREMNVRPSDLSSIFRNPNTLQNLRRLWQRGDAAAFDRVKREPRILHYVIHNLLALSPPLFHAMGERLRIINLLRHPLYMVKQWRIYIEEYGTNARDLTVWIKCKGHALPFFAAGWEEEYLASSPMDRVILSIYKLHLKEQQVLAQLPPTHRAQVLIVPFELFVLRPEPILKQFEELLGSRVTDVTRREMKRQRVPRQRIADGIALPIYQKYGWQPAQKGSSERAELIRRREYVAREASPSAMALLDQMCADYEAQYLHELDLERL